MTHDEINLSGQSLTDPSLTNFQRPLLRDGLCSTARVWSMRQTRLRCSTM